MYKIFGIIIYRICKPLWIQKCQTWGPVQSYDKSWTLGHIVALVSTAGREPKGKKEEQDEARHRSVTKYMLIGPC